MDIKDIAKNLKGKTAVSSEEKKNEKKQIGKQSEYFMSLQRILKDKKYNNKSNTYIDTDISEVLSNIKSRGKIPIASLLSYIVEEWITTHKEDIRKLPTNKYLK